MALEKLSDGPGRLDLDHAHPFVATLEHAGARGPVGQRDPRADPQAPARTAERLPAALLQLTHHEQLDGGVLALEGAQKPCGDDPALVDQHAVAGAQPPRQIREARVLPSATPPVHHEQARSIARLRGRLRDSLGGQRIVEQGEVHDFRSLAPLANASEAPGSLPNLTHYRRGSIRSSLRG